MPILRQIAQLGHPVLRSIAEKRPIGTEAALCHLAWRIDPAHSLLMVLPDRKMRDFPPFLEL
ncbi:MAG: hypothetical protein A2X84_08170 [Desulfuromonadaceae bacterium GWC2_58_13]|nr:MAG: hypothetical protein A2X84_08170 [Desulfuromonadaceae bacterium GWC2_58_13]